MSTALTEVMCAPFKGISTQGVKTCMLVFIITTECMFDRGVCVCYEPFFFFFLPQGIPDCSSSKHCFHSDNGEERKDEKKVTARVIRVNE